MFYLLIIIVGVVLLTLLGLKKRRHYEYLEDFFDSSNTTQFVESMPVSGRAVNLSALLEQGFKERIKTRMQNLYKQFGRWAWLKIVFLIAGLLAISFEINRRFLHFELWITIGVILPVGLIMTYFWLQRREKSQFEQQFPDALNMMTSAVSSGESVMHAILYVGEKLEGDIGREFNLMGQRLKLGESPDEVFRKSCRRYPYPSFYFFVITLRANIQRGGQLKEVMHRLNRTMFNAHAIEKKKYALTSEARSSAKIVAAIPFVFLFILQFLSPDNYEFVMFNESGRQILYYMVASEAIGIGIIWALMKSVR